MSDPAFVRQSRVLHAIPGGRIMFTHTSNRLNQAVKSFTICTPNTLHTFNRPTKHFRCSSFSNKDSWSSNSATRFLSCHSDPPELLTVEEFAKRLRVGRSTVFLWIASKKMVQGIHYFKIARTLRIPFSMELLASLSVDSEETPPSPVRSGKNRQTINLDY